MNLILIDPSELDADGLARVAGTRARHIRHVLRATIGDDVRVGVIDGCAGVGTVEAIEDDAIVMRCAFEAEMPPRPMVDLLLAVPRPKVMRRLWAQIAAMGVGQIILTNAERVERDYFGAHTLDEVTYRPLVIEGLQQARDTRVPIVSVHKRFKVLIEDDLDTMCPDAMRVVAHPGVDAMEVRSHNAFSSNARVLLAVGPESGWNDFELKLLEAHGFHPMSMGPRSLRTDTACIALLALVHAAVQTRS